MMDSVGKEMKVGKKYGSMKHQVTGCMSKKDSSMQKKL